MSNFPSPGDRYGHFVIERQIGRGGMGVVCAARDVTLNRLVALKIVLPSLADAEEYSARFAREAAALAKVRSRNIIQIHEYGEQDGSLYLVTELVPDGDLKSWLGEHGAFSRLDALRIIDQVCEGLDDAHRAGVLHRDVKPSNVLLWRRQTGLVPYLCDFGIAADQTADGLTRSGTVIGSIAYMAPERHLGQPADARGDVYSVGCLLWALLSGSAPYSGTEFQLMNAHVNDPAPRLATGTAIDDQIDVVLAHAMAKDPDDRIPTMSALRAEIAAIIQDQQPAGQTGETGTRTTPERAGTTGPARVDDDLPTTVRTSSSSGPGTPVSASTATPGPDDEAGSRTTRRSGRTPATGPSPTAEIPPSKSGHRTSVLVAILAVVLAGAAATVGLVMANSGPSHARHTTEHPAPAAPKVRVKAGYRSVAFTIGTTPGTRLQLKDGEGWHDAAPKRTVTTARGGTRVCVVVRALAPGESGNPSSSTRTCAKSAPPTVQLTSTGSCLHNGYEQACYRLDLAGFESRHTLRLALVIAGRTVARTSVRTNATGRARHPVHFDYNDGGEQAQVIAGGIRSKPITIPSG